LQFVKRAWVDSLDKLYGAKQNSVVYSVEPAIYKNTWQRPHGGDGVVLLNSPREIDYAKRINAD